MTIQTAHTTEPPGILVLHGPNLNDLGRREPEIYGRTTLEEINRSLRRKAREAGAYLVARQHQSEGALIEELYRSRPWASGLIINPGGLTHTSVALRDAVLAFGRPAVEVHLSDIHAREEFRHHSFLEDIVLEQIKGLGPRGYLVALDRLLYQIRAK